MLKRAERGKPVKALEERPELYRSIEPYYQDFLFLKPYRHPEGGLIPLNEIKAYLDIRGIFDFDERADFMKIIHDMDLRFLEYQNEKHENNDDSSKNKQNKNNTKQN